MTAPLGLEPNADHGNHHLTAHGAGVLAAMELSGTPIRARRYKNKEAPTAGLSAFAVGASWDATESVLHEVSSHEGAATGQSLTDQNGRDKARPIRRQGDRMASVWFCVRVHYSGH